MPIRTLFGQLILSAADERDIAQAIGDAEKGTRGEVRVHVERSCPDGDAVARAKQMFAALGMHETEDDTGVLLYVAWGDRVAAVWAGSGIHAAAKEGFWDDIVGELAYGFSHKEGGRAIVRAVRRIGNLLRKHAPGEDHAGDELPNELSIG